MRWFFLLIFVLITFIIANGQERKWFHNVEGGIITYGPATKNLGYSFRTIHGKEMYTKWSLGVGSGFEKFILDDDDDHKVLPLFVQTKYDFSSNKKSTFYGAFDIGYAFNLTKGVKTTQQETDYFGGLLISPQLGFKRFFKDSKESLYLSFGYKIQHVKKKGAYKYQYELFNSSTNNDEYDSYQIKKYNLQRLTVMLGIEF